jgi:hypothetical protein
MAIVNLKELEGSLNLKEGTLKSAFESETEETIDISTLSIRTIEDDETRTANLKTEYHTAGREIAIKTAREDYGLDFQGKNMENLMSAIKTKVLAEANVEPSAKIKELTADNEKLKSNIEGLQTEVNDGKILFAKQKTQSSIASMIDGAIQGDLTISKDDAALLFKNKFGTELNEGGKLLISQNGEVMKNTTTLDPVGITDVMTDFLSAYTKKVEGGAGGTDQTGGGKEGTMDAFNKEMANSSVTIGSQPYNEEMAKRLGAGTLKV